MNNNTLRRIIAILFVLISMTLWARIPERRVHTYPASAREVTYVGRAMVQGDIVSFDWTATYLRVDFTGRYLGLQCGSTGCDYLNVWIDRPMAAEPDTVLMVSGQDQRLSLYLGSNYERHSIVLQKRTEGEQGRLMLYQWLVDGMLEQAAPLKPRLIEVIGDSYSCGYGIEHSLRTDRFTPQTENPAKTYAAIIARYFDADYMVLAHSGMGVVRNYHSKYEGWTMPVRYAHCWDMDSTAATLWTPDTAICRPDMTIIYLGGNDFSTGMQPSFSLFDEAYWQLLHRIKDYYGPDHPILCLAKPDEAVADYVQRVVRDCGMEQVHFFANRPGVYCMDNSNLGADSHPNYEAHRKLAYTFIPYISSILGWPLSNIPIQ